MTESQPPKPVYPPWLIWVMVLVFMLLFFNLLNMQAPEQQRRVYFEIPYTDFKHQVLQGNVLEIELRGEAIKGHLVSEVELGARGETGNSFRTRMPTMGDPALLVQLEEHDVTMRVLSDQPGGLATVLVSWIPFVFVLLLWFWIIRRASRNVAGGGLSKQGELGRFLRSGVKEANVPDVTFSDVAGQENAKREVTELVEYLRQPDKFERLGAEVPRGVLLMGPPGTGKTLLARALAGEAKVPFYTISASEFIEVFVGVGASRVRTLFSTAKEHAPSILFIDELDSVGRTRGTGLGGGHDEREQTLNQILAEMDGFEGHEAVIVLAATNRPDVLDPALLRPGRFDRHVTLDLPDTQDREAILKVHISKVPLADDVDIEKIAAGCPGFSGADIKNLVNEAAIFAARENKQQVTMDDFDSAHDKLILGTERALAIEPDEKHRLAVHEAGHTLVAYFSPNTDPLYKVTIIPHGQALGGTHQLPEVERHTLPEEYLHDRLAVMLAGRAAEKALLGSLSSGADNDIQQASSLARAMVARWGMSDEVGPVDLRESESHPFLGREMAQPRHFSESSAEMVDKAIQKQLRAAEEVATNLIKQHRAELLRLISALEAKETLHKDEIEQCLSGSNVHTLTPQHANSNKDSSG